MAARRAVLGSQPKTNEINPPKHPFFAVIRERQAQPFFLYYTSLARRRQYAPAHSRAGVKHALNIRRN